MLDSIVKWFCNKHSIDSSKIELQLFSTIKNAKDNWLPYDAPDYIREGYIKEVLPDIIVQGLHLPPSPFNKKHIIQLFAEDCIDIAETLCHELVHVWQIERGDLVIDVWDDGWIAKYWEGREVNPLTPYSLLPWEIEAHRLQREVYNEYRYKNGLGPGPSKRRIPTRQRYAEAERKVLLSRGSSKISGILMQEKNGTGFTLGLTGVCKQMLPIDILPRFSMSNKDQHDLAEMNDTGKTFNEIANWIEENL